MKKKYFFILTLFFVSISILNIGMNFQNEKSADIIISNVEALAEGEVTAVGCCKEMNSVCFVDGEKFCDTRPCAV